MPQGIHLGSGIAVNGQVLVDGVALTVKQAAVNMTSLGPSTIVAAVATKKLRVLGWSFWLTLPATLEFRSSTTALIQAFDVPARQMVGGMWHPGHFCETVAGEALTLRQTQGTAATLRGVVLYVEV